MLPLTKLAVSKPIRPQTQVDYSIQRMNARKHEHKHKQTGAHTCARLLCTSIKTRTNERQINATHTFPLNMAAPRRKHTLIPCACFLWVFWSNNNWGIILLYTTASTFKCISSPLLISNEPFTFGPAFTGTLSVTGVDFNNSPFISCQNAGVFLTWHPCLLSCNISLVRCLLSFRSECLWRYGRMDEEFVGRIGNETSCFLLVGSHDTAGDVWLAEGQSKPSRFHQLPQTYRMWTWGPPVFE